MAVIFPPRILQLLSLHLLESCWLGEQGCPTWQALPLKALLSFLLLPGAALLTSTQLPGHQLVRAGFFCFCQVKVKVPQITTDVGGVSYPDELPTWQGSVPGSFPTNSWQNFGLIQTRQISISIRVGHLEYWPS